MNWEIKSEGKFKYIEEGEGEVLLLLHGLFGSLSNWDEFIGAFNESFFGGDPFMQMVIVNRIAAMAPVPEKVVEQRTQEILNIVDVDGDGEIDVFTLEEFE